jgi:hypothetical protein
LQDIAQIWKLISKFTDEALQSLVSVKSKSPEEAASHLYGLILDYKLEIVKKLSRVTEEIECEKTPLPRELFPSLK